MIAVSRCLIGENCTYAGKNNLCKEIKELYDQGLALPLCPEVLGGLPIPRTPCEVTGEKVIDQKGIDRTKEYTQGAKIALDKCLEKNIKIAVLKAKSPSCGKNHIYVSTSARLARPSFARILYFIFLLPYRYFRNDVLPVIFRISSLPLLPSQHPSLPVFQLRPSSASL